MNADKSDAEKNGHVPKQFPHADLTERILEAAFTVSNSLGCGFLEKVYENALAIELEMLNLRATRQTPVRIQYKGQTVGEYVSDLVVENAVLIEVKATDEDNMIYHAQTINYLKATGLRVGLLMNFGQKSLNTQRIVR